MQQKNYKNQFKKINKILRIRQKFRKTAQSLNPLKQFRRNKILKPKIIKRKKMIHTMKSFQLNQPMFKINKL